MSIVGQFWRRLFGGDASRAAEHGLEVLAPPAGYTPREGEVIHAEGIARGSDKDRDTDYGGGTLLMTNRAVVFFTARKKWRFRWRGVEQMWVESSEVVHLATKGGKRFSFEMSSVAEAEAIGAVADALIEMRRKREEEEEEEEAE